MTRTKKNYPVVQIKQILKDFRKSKLPLNTYANNIDIPGSTLRQWNRNKKYLVTTVKIINKPDAQMEMDEILPEVSDSIRITAIREHLVKGTSLKKVARDMNQKYSQVTYWKTMWIKGRLIIPGVPVTKELVESTSMKGRQPTAKPLFIDNSAQQEIAKLKVQNQYLKELLTENDIEFELDKVSGEAKDKYLMDIIEAHGIDLALD